MTPRGDDVEVKARAGARLVVNSVSARRAEASQRVAAKAGRPAHRGGPGGCRSRSGPGQHRAPIAQGKDIHDLYGYSAVVHVLSASGIRKGTRYVLRVAKDGEALARQTGLLDMRGRPVRGFARPGGMAAWGRRGGVAALPSRTVPDGAGALIALSQLSRTGGGAGAGGRGASTWYQRQGPRGA